MAAPFAKAIKLNGLRQYSTRICSRGPQQRYDKQCINTCVFRTSGHYCQPRCQFISIALKSKCLSLNLRQIDSNALNFCSVPHDERHCWKCNSKTSAETELFFCNCGVVQKVPSDLTYFKAMGLEEAFDIDTEHLSMLYKDLQRKLHPDKFSQHSQKEQLFAEKQSAFVNKAYTTLLKPLTRGLYLLELFGIPLEEGDNQVDNQFLMEIMETNEDLVEAEGNDTAVSELEKINKSRMDLTISLISEHFKSDNLTAAKQALVKLQYFSNIDEKIKAMLRKKMDH